MARSRSDNAPLEPPPRSRHGRSRALRQRRLRGLALGAALGAVIGVLLHLRLQAADPRRLAGRAQALSADAIDGALEGQVVAVTGVLRADAPLGDPGLLRPGDYVELWRDVEIFAWHEVEEAPGVYRYQPRWGPDPPATAELHMPEGHDNPPVRLRSEVRSAPHARVGAYRFRPAQARLLAQPLRLSPDMLAEDDRRNRLSEGFLYLGTGTEEAPHLGDVRVRYLAVAAGQVVTLLGEQQGEEIVPVYDVSGARLYHLLPGPHSGALRALPLLLSQRPALLR